MASTGGTSARAIYEDALNELLSNAQPGSKAAASASAALAEHVADVFVDVVTGP